jgi:hypothetical protein
MVAGGFAVRSPSPSNPWKCLLQESSLTIEITVVETMWMLHPGPCLYGLAAVLDPASLESPLVMGSAKRLFVSWLLLLETR